MAGPLDLTGQNIENTYQRILQTDGTLIYDGTGSLFNIINSTGSFTGSFTGSLEGTASYALQAFSSSYALSSSLAEAALGAYYATQALNSTFADTASYAIQALNSTFSDTASYALQALNSTLANTASYALLAETSSFVQLIQGPGIIVNGLEITASVQSVNGIFPTNGNISTALTATITGTSASLVVSSSGNVTASLPDGLVWIISNDPTASNNGDSYIFSSGSVGQWYPISTLDVAAADTRYLKLDASNGPMTGNLDMGNYNINNVGTMTGTASYASQALTASYASSALSSSYALTASYAIGAQTFPYTGSALITGSLGVTGSISTTTNINLLNTTSSAVGVINKGGLRFLHDFKHATGGTAVPTGKNVMLGENAGNFTMGSTATSTQHASYNTLIGTNAGFSTTIGFINTFVGYNAGLNATTGYSNVFFGANSGQNTTTGYFNVYLGERSGQGASLGVGAGTGYNNVGIGALTLTSNTSGFTNVFIGYSAGSANTTGFQNAAIHGGGNNTTGYNNVFVGYNAGGSLADNTANQTSTFSVFLGANTKALSAGNTNQIVIGNNAIGSGSNTVTIGDTNITDNYLRGFLKVTGNNKTLPTGNITNQYWNHFTPNTASFVGASTVTSSYGLFVEAAIAGTNATITNNFALGTTGRVQIKGSSSDLIDLGTNDGGFYNIKLGYNGVIGSTTGPTQLGNLGGNALGYYLPSKADGSSVLANTWSTGKITYQAYQHNFTFQSSANQSAEYSRLLITGGQVNFTSSISTQRFAYLTSPTIVFNTSNTVTSSYGLYVEAAKAGTNATITNNYAAGFSGSVYISSGLVLGTTSSAFIGSGQVYASNGFLSNANSSLAGIIGYTNNLGLYSKFGNGAVSIGHNGGTTTVMSIYSSSMNYTGSAFFTGSLTVTGPAEFVGRISQTGLGSSIFIGQNAGLTDDLTTNVNVAIGNSALRLNKDGTQNIAIGESTLFYNTGSNNVALGAYALQLKTIGGENMAIGTFALNQLSTGSGNVAVGVLSLFNAQGNYNVGIGGNALYDVTGGVNTGRGNIGIGYNTGRGITTGEYNTIIGASVTGLSSSLSNNIIIADGVGNIAFRVNPTTGLTGLTRIIPRTTTNQTATTEISAFIFNGVTTTWQTGTIATQRNFYLPSQTYAFNGASTITNAYGLYAEAPTAGTNATITNNYAAGFSGSINLIDTSGIAFGTTTGGKIGTATTQKLSFWNAIPIVQPTTAVAAATLVSGGGTTLTNTDTFDGYTLQQVVKALRDAGLLA